MPLALLFVVLVAQQCSAMKVIQGYAVEIFSDAFSHSTSGLKQGMAVEKDAYTAAVIMGVVRLISTLISAKYIKNFGRKTMYFLSAILTIFFQLLFGIVDVLNLGYNCKSLPIFIISAQVFSLQLGLQSFPNLLSGELFPNDMRAKCKGLIRATSSLFSFAALKLFPYLFTHLGLYGSFWLCAFILLLICPIIFCFVPEAKDVHLNQVSGFFEQVTTKFYAKIPERKDAAQVEIGLTLGHDIYQNKSRIQMIENGFGTAGKPLNIGSRVLLAEGFLLKKTATTTRKQHFFLFDDLLVWGSVIRENINYIKQRIIPVDKISIEDVRNTNAWRVHAPGWDFLLEAATPSEKLEWMQCIEFAKNFTLQKAQLRSKDNASTLSPHRLLTAPNAGNGDGGRNGSNGRNSGSSKDSSGNSGSGRDRSGSGCVTKRDSIVVTDEQPDRLYRAAGAAAKTSNAAVNAIYKLVDKGDAKLGK